MKLPDPQLPASVLATVLVVCTLMLLGVLMVFHLWNMDLLYYDLYHRNEQARIHIESGFLLYSRDSSLMHRLDEDSTMLLFEGKQDSRLKYDREYWGLYEVVSILAANGRKKYVRLMGKTRESVYGAVLYVPENNRSFSLAGKTLLDGDLYLPRNGVAYTQMRSEFFQGHEIKECHRKISTAEFPVKEAELAGIFEKTYSLGATDVFSGRVSLKRSFTDPALRIEVGEYLAGVEMKGHILLRSPGDLFVEENNCLENIIICARKVEIADDFTGSVQVFATDTILLGDRVCLKAGSGLYVNNRRGECVVRMGEYCEINGYVVAEGGGTAEGERKKAIYYQPATSKVRGLVFVDGIAQVHGSITGSLYARSCYYFAPEGYYSEILYNATLSGHPEISYPLFMEGPYERKEVKWLE